MPLNNDPEQVRDSASPAIRPSRTHDRAHSGTDRSRCRAERHELAPRSGRAVASSGETHFTMRSWHSATQGARRPGIASSKSSHVSRRRSLEVADPTSRQNDARGGRGRSAGRRPRPCRTAAPCRRHERRGSTTTCSINETTARVVHSSRACTGSRPRTEASPTREGRDRTVLSNVAHAGRPWWSRMRRPAQPNATIILTSILRRGGAPGGDDGSSNDVCGHTAARRPRVSSCLMKSTSSVAMRET